VVLVLKKELLVFSDIVPKHHKYERPQSCSYRSVYEKFFHIHAKYSSRQRDYLSYSGNKPADKSRNISVFFEKINTEIVVVFADEPSYEPASAIVSNGVVYQRSRYTSS
jgi:hypothetical protein